MKDQVQKKKNGDTVVGNKLYRRQMKLQNDYAPKLEISIHDLSTNQQARLDATIIYSVASDYMRRVS